MSKNEQALELVPLNYRWFALNNSKLSYFEVSRCIRLIPKNEFFNKIRKYEFTFYEQDNNNTYPRGNHDEKLLFYKYLYEGDFASYKTLINSSLYNDSIYLLFQCLSNKNYNAFKLVPENRRHEVFKYLDAGENNISSFKLVPGQFRKEVFIYLDRKNIDAFKLIPNEDKIFLFQYIEQNERNYKALKLVPENSRFLVFILFNKKI